MCDLKVSLGKKWPKDNTLSKHKNLFPSSYSIAGEGELKDRLSRLTSE